MSCHSQPTHKAKADGTITVAQNKPHDSSFTSFLLTLTHTHTFGTSHQLHLNIYCSHYKREASGMRLRLVKDRGSGLVEVECSLLEWLGQVRLEGLMKWLAQGGMQLIEMVRIG